MCIRDRYTWRGGTVADILSKPEYMGHTVNFRTYKESYKDKRSRICLLYTSIDEKVKEARQIMTKVSVDMIGFYFKVDVPKCSNSDENTPFADAADDETVSIPKGEYELMIDDLLTMSEIIQCVADMRTQDVLSLIHI